MNSLRERERGGILKPERERERGGILKPERERGGY
jgi:hypothetical protein